jgi:hypothetical protein
VSGMEEKRPYYVSVGSQTMMTNEDDSSFEFEILATPVEALELMDLFARTENQDENLISRASTPYESFAETPYGGQDSKNEPYEENLMDIYRAIYRLGVPETKKHIEEMQVL